MEWQEIDKEIHLKIEIDKTIGITTARGTRDSWMKKIGGLGPFAYVKLKSKRYLPSKLDRWLIAQTS